MTTFREFVIARLGQWEPNRASLIADYIEDLSNLMADYVDMKIAELEKKK